MECRFHYVACSGTTSSASIGSETDAIDSSQVVNTWQSRLSAADARVGRDAVTLLHDLQQQLADLKPELLRCTSVIHHLELELQEAEHDKADLHTHLSELRGQVQTYERGASSTALMHELSSMRGERDDMLLALKSQQREHARLFEALDDLEHTTQRLAATEAEVSLLQARVVQAEEECAFYQNQLDEAADRVQGLVGDLASQHTAHTAALADKDSNILAVMAEKQAVDARLQQVMAMLDEKQLTVTSMSSRLSEHDEHKRTMEALLQAQQVIFSVCYGCVILRLLIFGLL
jgi:chromosome segregation ATPase